MDFIEQKNLVKKITDPGLLKEVINLTNQLHIDLGRENLGLEGHELVEFFILEHHPKAVSIETPVWRELKGRSTLFSGHVDIILIHGNEIIIADYKPRGREEILKAIPQLTAYGILLKNRLDILLQGETMNDLKITCIGFNREEGYYFNPFKVKEHILKFLKYEEEVSSRSEAITSQQSDEKLVDDFKSIL